MSALPTLDHVQLAAPAGGEAAARAFYGGVLGLPEVEKPPGVRASGGVWFALADGAGLHLGVAERFTPATKAHPGLRVPGGAEALRALADRLLAAPAPVTWDERIVGVLRLYTADPFGNRIELRA